MAGAHGSHHGNGPAGFPWPTLCFCALPLAGFVFLLGILAGMAGPLPVDFSRAWAPSFGVDWNFRIDGLAALMLLLITGVGVAVFAYAGGYMAGHPQQVRLYVLLSLFFGAMVGCVSADNLILLFVFWELTSLTSFLLVGFNHESPESRRSAQQALMVTGTGGLALLAGFLILGREFGTYRISELLPLIAATEPTTALQLALALILIGCFTKSAQIPFHFWLPNAMAAPTPVSAYLHSATMVKLGVYLMARLDPGFGEWAIWTVTLQVVGSITAAWAMVLAVGERDLKRILAWSTVATLGTLTMLIGVPGAKAAAAASALLLAHAMYKAPLFFVAGNIDHGTGTRIIDRLGNLRTKMPWTAAAALLAGISMAGIPFTFGFVAKEAAGLAKKGSGVLDFVPFANTMFASVAVAVAAVAALRVFWPHPGRNESCPAHEGGALMVTPPLVLAGFGLFLGVFPQTVEWLVYMAATSMVAAGTEVPAHLDNHVLSGVSSVLVTLGIGAAVFFGWDLIHKQLDRTAAWLNRRGMAAQYEYAMKSIPVVAAKVTRLFQTGRLADYLTMAVGAAAFALVVAGMGGGLPPLAAWEWPSLPAALACLVVLLGAGLACVVRQRLVLLLASGLVGYGSALLFLFTGAPDLAFTQFSVETLFVVVMSAVLLALIRARHEAAVAEPLWRPGHAIVAGALGLVIGGLMLAALAGPLPPDLADYFAANSLPRAQGRNVVNVIIVDFRGLDTLGESAVVLISFLAAVPVLGLLVRGRSANPGKDAA